MKIELNPVDPISFILFTGYKEGAVKYMAKKGHPCSICREHAKPGKTRAHFHGSELGQCQLAVYRKMNEGRMEPPESQPESLLDGHLHEAAIFDNLIAAGLEVVAFENDPRFERVVAFKVTEGKISTVALDKIDPESTFKIVLHFDGLLETEEDITAEESPIEVNEKKIYGIECKSVREYTWKKIKDTSEISDQWYGQIQAYMAGSEITRFYLIVKHRMTSDILKPIPVDINWDYLQTRLKGLKQIYDAITTDDLVSFPVEKEGKNSKDSQCRFCSFKDDCWG